MSPWRLTSLHTGKFIGRAATGKRVDIAVMDYFRVSDGRQAEHGALMHNFNLLKQIGAIEA